jgi:hypothetical protein
MSTAPAKAAVTVYYTLSTNTGLSGYNIGDLTGNSVFTVNSPSAGFLDIKVTNTAAIDADIAAIFFNFDSAGATLSALTQLSTTQGGLTTSGQQNKQADGFGTYDYKLLFDGGPSTYLQQGKSVEVKIAYTGTLNDSALSTEFSSGDNAGSPFIGAVDWKPNVAGTGGVLTGFGAGSLTPPPTGADLPVPEPASAVAWSLLACGAVGLAVVKRRWKSAA